MTNETNTEVTMTAKQLAEVGNASAKRARDMAGKATELTGVLAVIIDAKNEMAGGPLRVLCKLREIYGDDLEGVPMPGTDTGNNPDAISIDITDADGNTKVEKTTFVKVFTDATPAGKALLDRLEMCKRAAKADTVKDGIPADILELARTRMIGREIDQLEGKRSTYRAAIKKAFQLMHQFIAIGNVPDVIAEPIWQDQEGGEIIKAVNCIHVHEDTETERDGKTFVTVKYSRDYSVSSFLKLDAKKAIEGGGGFKALEATAERGTKTGKGDTPAEKLTIKTVPTFITVLAEFHRYLEEVSTDAKQADVGAIVKLVNSKDSDELISALIESRNSLNDIIEAGGIEAKYAKVQQRLARQAA